MKDYLSHYNEIMAADPATETYESLSRVIDVHLLDPLLSTDQLYEACVQAQGDGVRAVVVRPCDLELATPWFRSGNVILASACGYPDGTSTTAAKLYEGRDLLRLGLREIEFVLNPARLVSRQFQHIEAELLQISNSCHENAARLTVVLNSARLADDLKIIATKICRRVEADVLSIDGTESDLTVIRPLLKGQPGLKLGAPVTTLAGTLDARAIGYVSIAAVGQTSILSEWRDHLTARKQINPPAS